MTHGEQPSLDDATQARLAKLAAMPVDVADLQRQFRAAVATAAPAPVRRHPRAWWAAWSSLAAAAVIALAVAIGWLGVGSEPTVASAAALAQTHRQVISGQQPSIGIASLEEANRVLQSQWPSAPPAPMAANLDASVHACCVQEIEGKRAICVLMQHRGEAVTMIVAQRRQLCATEGRAVTHQGREYLVKQADGLHMVTGSSGGYWFCLVSALPQQDLLDLAGQLDFQRR